ncbi:MAG TPA: nickel pincer cofactor biosynthesis protein LarC, partial [Nitrososphaeraceae archaeon]|nr:nickel pincer cofactor biosynthesis protein LarC [Nitrososphaeraceae archaeon]
IAGLSGDMLLSALIDLGADKKKVIDSIYTCENIIPGSRIKDVRFEKIDSNGFSATRFYFEYKDEIRERKGIEMIKNTSQYLEMLDLKLRSKSFIMESIKTLVDAEAKIHGEPLDQVYLHEASSIDTFVDLIGCAIALEDLKIFDSKILSTYISIGNGLTTFSHGTIPNPTNAILEIFRGKPFVLTGNDQGELTTPTGAAMLVNLSSECIRYYPPFIPERIGLGAGNRKLKDRPNVLRLVIGKDPVIPYLNNERMFLIETNIDDVDGEIIGNLIEVLMKEGARDVTIIPGITKKNRPVNIIRVLSDLGNTDALMHKLFKETGTSGIRINEINRITLERNIINIEVIINCSKYNINIKITKDTSNNIINIKPEFDDLKKIADIEGRSLKAIQELVMFQIFKKFKANKYE